MVEARIEDRGTLEAAKLCQATWNACNVVQPSVIIRKIMSCVRTFFHDLQLIVINLGYVPQNQKEKEITNDALSLFKCPLRSQASTFQSILGIQEHRISLCT